jgi:hypothetical protein
MAWIMACCVLEATIAAEKVQDELSFVAVIGVFGFCVVFIGAEESQEVFDMDISAGWFAVTVDGSAIGGVVLDMMVGGGALALEMMFGAVLGGVAVVLDVAVFCLANATKVSASWVSEMKSSSSETFSSPFVLLEFLAAFLKLLMPLISAIAFCLISSIGFSVVGLGVLALLPLLDEGSPADLWPMTMFGCPSDAFGGPVVILC